MAAAWVCALDFDPPKITAVIDKNTYTRTLIEAEGTFAINIPCVAQVDVVRQVGTSSGRDFLGTDVIATASAAPQEAIQNAATFTHHGLPRRDAARNDGFRDKFSRFGLQTFEAKTIAAPLLAGCVAWLECKVISEPHNQSSYDLFIAEVTAAYADERVFSNGRWHFEEHDELRTIHHIAGGAFFATGTVLQANI